MSFRLFIYYCALWGGVAAFLGWGFGRVATGTQPVLEAAIKGLLLGMLVTLMLCLMETMVGLAEALKSFSINQLAWMLLGIGCSDITPENRIASSEPTSAPAARIAAVPMKLAVSSSSAK